MRSDFRFDSQGSTVVSRNEQIRGYYNTEDVSDLLKGLFKSSHHDQHGLLKLVKHNTEHPVELVVLLVDSAVCERKEKFTNFSQVEQRRSSQTQQPLAHCCTKDARVSLLLCSFCVCFRFPSFAQRLQGCQACPQSWRSHLFLGVR